MAPPLSREKEEALKKLYYEEKNFIGRDRLYELVKTKDLGISRRQVMDWLKDQEMHQLYNPVKTKPKIQPTVLNAPFKQVGVDLIDMSNYDAAGYVWIFTAIDLFSKKAYARALKNKDNNTATQAMRSILEEIGQPISSIRCDNGSEFVSSSFKSLMKRRNIKIVYSDPYKPTSNGIVERFNKSLKTAVKKNIYADEDFNWAKSLQNLIEQYNNTYHTTIKNTPNNVNDANRDEVARNIKNKVANKLESERNILSQFQNVRIKDEDGGTGINWSKKIYKIMKVYKPKNNIGKYTYKIKDIKTRELINEKFYREDLQPVVIPQIKKKDTEKYIISGIVRPVYVVENRPAYEVRWKGFGSGDNTNELREDLMKYPTVSKMVKTYERKNGVSWENDKNGKWRFRKK